MEKHKCKLCLRSFSNGRALGGHMRSHMMNLPLPPKETSDVVVHDDEEAADSASSQSLPPPPPPQQHRRRDSEEEEEEEDEDDIDIDKSLYYGLRENPKRSVKLVDPEFSMILQDRESETESSRNPTRRRSKRAKKPDPFFAYHHLDLHRSHGHCHDVAAAAKGKGAESCWAEPEPVSSISDATTEEDVAFCLMMMSRDNWRRKKKNRREYDYVAEEEDDGEEDDDSDKDEEEESEFEEEDRRQSPQHHHHQRQRQETSKCPKSNRNGGGNKYKCETCDKVFRSYQALGGHRASHKKLKLTHAVSSEPNDAEFKPRKPSNDSNASVIVGTTPPQAPAEKKKVHECPICFRVFASGQALGGHKRSHVIVVSHPETTPKQAAKTTTAVSPVAAAVERRLNNKMNGESLIDLNLPAPDYDDCYDDNDEISQIELSAVSDPEFVNNTTIRQ